MQSINSSRYSWDDYLRIVLPMSNRLQLSMYCREIDHSEVALVSSITKTMLDQTYEWLNSEAHRKHIESFVGDKSVDIFIEDSWEDWKNNHLPDGKLPYEVCDNYDALSFLKGTAFEHAYISHHFTFETAVTQGPLFRVFTFELTEVLKGYLSTFESQFDLFEVNGIVLEDPAFYQDDTLLGCVCSHEGMSTLIVDDKHSHQYESLMNAYNDKSEEQEYFGFTVPSEILDSIIDREMNGDMSSEAFLSVVMRHGKRCDPSDADVLVHLDDYSKYMKEKDVFE